MAGRNTVDVPVRKDNGSRAGVETLDVETLGPNRFRLVYSPGLVEGLAAGDEFELTGDNVLGYRVLHRGGNICAWFFFQERDHNRGPDGNYVRGRVQQLGGTCDGGMNYLLVSTFPLAVGFAPIEQLFDSLVQEFPGATWFYGNVYDPLDGATPLNWWQEGSQT